ncbi:hypothetical protein M0R04_05730 [Candidatus Dojkabacteria bacterium]|jgi:hypothetical protein|nr:hypothetical protein [Candidatus Dojkabacteria bacterium]
MSLLRVILNDTATEVGAYTVPLNPSFLDLHNSEKQVVMDVLDGGKIMQDSYFDDRPYVLRWGPIAKGAIAGFGTMVATIKAYYGDIKYVNFRDIDYTYPTLGWTKVRVGNCDVSIEQATGGGKIKYNVELSLYPEV